MSFFGRFFGSVARAHYRGAMQAYEAGAYEEALAGFQRALAAGAPRGDPLLHLAAFYAAEAATHLGRAALQAAAPARALEWLEPAVHGQAVSPALLELTAVAYLECDALASCAACVQALLVMDPGRAAALLLAAAVCSARGEAERAQSYVEAARAHAAPLALGDPVRRALAARAQRSAALAALLRDFLPSLQSSDV